MTDRYGRIREALAMGPTPGPWYWIGDSLTHRQFNIYAINGTDKHIATVNNLPVEKLWARDQVESEATAKLITACDPDTAQALLDERDALRKALEDIRSLSFINPAMQPNPLTLTALLGDIHQIADDALAQEDRNG